MFEDELTNYVHGYYESPEASRRRPRPGDRAGAFPRHTAEAARRHRRFESPAQLDARSLERPNLRLSNFFDDPRCIRVDPPQLEPADPKRDSDEANEDIQIINGDCRAVMRALPAGSAKLVVTSPPYNIGKAYEARISLDAWVDDQCSVIVEAARLLADGGSICWQVGNYVDRGELVPLDSLIVPLIRAAGLKIRNRIVWAFGHGLHCRNRLSGRHETVVWATKGDSYSFNLDHIRIPQKYPQKRHFKGPKKGQLSGHPLGKNPGDVWEIPNVRHNHPEKTLHPCQFPEALIEKLTLALTNPGDLIVDPYAGSGTTGAVADRLRRRAILIERDAGYADIASRRISRPSREKAVADRHLIGDGDVAFQERTENHR
jgi:adenine-specific DNA-methyltransferase